MIKESSNIREYINFVKRGLEKEFSLKLQIDFKLSNQDNLIFDLADNERHFYVEVKPIMKSVDQNSIIRQINHQKNILNRLYPDKKITHFLVFQNSINNKEKEEFFTQLDNNQSQQYVFDIEDIKSMVNTSIIDSSNKPDKGKIIKSNIEEIDNKTFDKLKEIIGNVNYFVAGHLWDDIDQMPRFIKDNNWENGNESIDTDTVNRANKGDVIFLKSAFAKKKIGILRIKAIGVIIVNKKDGHNLEVNWYKPKNHIDIEGLSKYRRTFARVMNADLPVILENVIKDVPDLENIYNSLKPDKNSKINSSNLEFNEQFKTHRFLRDVLNKEYDLKLVIETARILNGANIKLDLTDDKAKSFAVILNKEDRIMSRISSEIGQDIDLLMSGNFVEKYFAFFDDPFNKEDIIQIKELHKKNDNDILHILTLADVIKLAEKNGIKYSEYLNNNLDTGKGEETIPRNKSDKIPFHLDQVVNEDKLGREPVAKEFVRLIKNDIFTDKLDHSFMVHLQGKWGSGKSSFLNFIKKNLNADEEDWIIVEYNAWQNQHISPPWWSLIDQVYLKSKEQLNWRACFHLWRKEVFRRIWRYSGWDKIITFVIFLVSVLCVIYFGNDILNIFSINLGSGVTEAAQSKSFISSFGDALKLMLTLASMVGVLFAFAKFITVPFFINSAKEAKSFVLRASDPMNKIKEHFNKLVDDINSKEKKRQLAIFIDDIDRCDKEFIVQLLEGIQTLFKDKRVLYIVAGDKNWISTSFGKTYEDFITEEVDKKQLGEFFIEKAFQLSFRLPNISEASKQIYWDYILGMENSSSDQKFNSIIQLSADKQDELKSELQQSKSELTDPEFVQKLQDKYNLSGDTASNIVIQEKNKNTEELKHLLGDYHTYIDTNPRSIIRLANNYTMARSILMAERVSFNEHKLFRWLVIEDLCPEVKSVIPSAENISAFEEAITNTKDPMKQKNSLELLKGQEEFMEGEIKIEDIKTIKGL